MDSALPPVAKDNEPRRGVRLLRFIAAGAFNTVISIGFYQAALFIMGHLPAYVLAYAVGVAVAYYLYARHVFAAQTSVRGFVLFAAFYGASALLGGMINAGLIEALGWHARLAIFVTIVLMLPVNFFGSRWLLLRGATRKLA